MIQLVFIEKGQAVTDSLTVAEVFGKDHNNVLKDIRKQIVHAGPDFAAVNFYSGSYLDKNSQKRPKFNLTEEAFTLVVFSYNTKEAVRTKIKFIQEFKRMRESLTVQPKTQLEILQASINQLVAQEKRVNEIEQKTIRIEQENQVLKHRIDNLDQVNIEGDLRQRLNGMIKLYAHSIGGRYSDAWKEFVQAFNTAFRTNIELRRQNHINKTGKDISRPKFLEEIGQIEDAIRVVDKLLNNKKARVR